MLESLDHIPWHELHHAYGTAEDVPILIRSLMASGDAQKEALYELFGNIWHQGTVYEASSYAVPFLVEVAADPGFSRRDEILGLIAALAKGNSYIAVHDQLPAISACLRKDPEFESNRLREVNNVRRTRDAVFAKRSFFLSLLSDTTPMVRTAAAYVLSQFPEAVTEFGLAIIAAATSEPHMLARAGLLWCIGAVNDHSLKASHLLEQALQPKFDPWQQCAAAISLRRIAGEPHDAADRVLARLMPARHFAESFLSGVPWDFSAEVSEFFDELSEEIDADCDGATKMLLEALDFREAVAPAGASVIHDLIEINFPRGWRAPSLPLSDQQRQILRMLAEVDEIWNDLPRLWFLLPGKVRPLSVTQDSVNAVRAEMGILAGRIIQQ